MTKHRGEIVLENIRKRQRAELQRRTVINPVLEHIMADPRLKNLITEIDELNSLLSERSKAAEEIAGEIASAIQSIEAEIDAALELVESQDRDDDVDDRDDPLNVELVKQWASEDEAADVGEEAAE
jgi:hypothetical protein